MMKMIFFQIQPLLQDNNDDFEMGIEWEKEHDWTTPNTDFKLQETTFYKEHLHRIQDESVSQEQNSV